MPIWSSELKELEKLYESFKGQLPEVEKELGQLLKTEDANVIMLYARRCLEVIITDLCEIELNRPRKTEPLKGIIDKLNREDKVPSHLITSMHSLNSHSTYGTHPKDFDPEQVKPVLVNLDIIIKWYLKYKDLQVTGKTEEVKCGVKKITTSPPEKSIIVIPFENISPDPDQEYFSDGLTEEIITDLSHISDLFVISRSSAMVFKGTKISIKEIAEKVNVRYVLEGSVRKAGNNLRITAQLIDGLSDSHLWAEKYTSVLDDIFDVQEKVSRSIVDSLKIRLSSDEKHLIQKRKFDNSAAYEQYLLARNEIWRCTKESLTHAIQIIESSINTIGRNEYLLVALGFAYFQYVNTGIDPDPKYLDKADELTNEALKLNPSLSKAHLYKGYIFETRGMLKESFESLRNAIKYDPNDAELLIILSFMYSMIGRPELAKPYAEKGLTLDPLNPIMYYGHWFIHVSEGKFDMALEDVTKMYNLDTENIASANAYTVTLIMNNRNEEATVILEKFIDTYPDTSFAQLYKGYRYAINNDFERALESITQELIRAAEMDHLWAWMLAEIYSIIGEKNKAIDLVERATRDVFINYPFFAYHDPLLENIRGEERFKKLMERVKFKWENFEV